MLEFGEIVRVREQDAHVVGIQRDAGMCIIECRYSVVRLVWQMMFSAVGGAIVGTLYLKAWGCAQIEQDNYRK